MADTLWLQNDKLIVDENGNLVLCDHCPCDDDEEPLDPVCECPNLPANVGSGSDTIIYIGGVPIYVICIQEDEICYYADDGPPPQCDYGVNCIEIEEGTVCEYCDYFRTIQEAADAYPTGTIRVPQDYTEGSVDFHGRSFTIEPIRSGGTYTFANGVVNAEHVYVKDAYFNGPSADYGVGYALSCTFYNIYNIVEPFICPYISCDCTFDQIVLASGSVISNCFYGSITDINADLHVEAPTTGDGDGSIIDISLVIRDICGATINSITTSDAYGISAKTSISIMYCTICNISNIRAGAVVASNTRDTLITNGFNSTVTMRGLDRCYSISGIESGEFQEYTDIPGNPEGSWVSDTGGVYISNNVDCTFTGDLAIGVVKHKLYVESNNRVRLVDVSLKDGLSYDNGSTPIYEGLIVVGWSYQSDQTPVTYEDSRPNESKEFFPRQFNCPDWESPVYSHSSSCNYSYYTVIYYNSADATDDEPFGRWHLGFYDGSNESSDHIPNTGPPDGVEVHEYRYGLSSPVGTHIYDKFFAVNEELGTPLTGATQGQGAIIGANSECNIEITTGNGGNSTVYAGTYTTYRGAAGGDVTLGANTSGGVLNSIYATLGRGGDAYYVVDDLEYGKTSKVVGGRGGLLSVDECGMDPALANNYTAVVSGVSSASITKSVLANNPYDDMIILGGGCQTDNGSIGGFALSADMVTPGPGGDTYYATPLTPPGLGYGEDSNGVVYVDGVWYNC